MKPTLSAVRKALGAGSYTTIQEAMLSWRTARTAATATREMAPQNVLDKANLFASELWALATGRAHEKLAVDREAFEQERVQLEAARKEAMETADSLALELEQTRQLLAKDSAKTKELERQISALREANVRAEASNQELTRQFEVEAQNAAQAREDAARARETAAEIKGALATLESSYKALLEEIHKPAPPQPPVQA